MRTKLTEEQVTEIFSYRWENKDVSDSPLIGKCHVLAKRFKVSPKAIRDIWNMRTWTHVTHAGSGGPKEGTDSNPAVKSLGAVAEENDETQGNIDVHTDRQDKGCSPISFATDGKIIADTKKPSPGSGLGLKDGADTGLGKAQAIREMLRQQMADTEVVPNLEFGAGLHSTLQDVAPTSAMDTAAHRMGAQDLALGKRARPDMMHARIDMPGQLASLNSGRGNGNGNVEEFQKRARTGADTFGPGLALGSLPQKVGAQGPYGAPLKTLLPNMPLGASNLQRNDSTKSLDPVLESIARMTFERQNSAQALSRMGTMTALPVPPASGLGPAPPLSGGLGHSAQSVTASNIAMLQQLVNSTASTSASMRTPNLLAHLQQALPQGTGPVSGPSQQVPLARANNGGAEAWRAGVAGLR